jgi:hypothetical protein
MAQIVEAHTGEARNARREPRKFMGEASRLQRLTVGLAANKGLPVLPDAKQCQILRLLRLQAAQFVDGKGGEGDRSGFFRLGRLEAQSRLRLLNALDDPHRGAINIDVFPP